jgi:FkbM family methyltransferase
MIASAPTRTRRWIVRKVRRLVGTDHVVHLLDRQADLIARTITDGPRPRPSSEAEGRDVSLSGSEVLTELNGDPVIFPADLLPYILHTKVSPPDADVLQFLFETPHYWWIRQRLHPGANVLDIGANIGLFSIMMARQIKYGVTGWVQAFEPSPRSRGDLQRMLASNHIDHVAVYPYAVSDRCGKATFLDVTTEDVTRESSHLDAVGPADGTGSLPHNAVEVETIDVDTFCDRIRFNPQLIKIDVEGAEFLVLEGARRCILTHKPFLVIEIHPDARGDFDHQRLRRYLDQYDYRYHHQGKVYYCE